MTQIPRPKKLVVNQNSGLNGAIPTKWDKDWQLYTDLTPSQVKAFQSFPEMEEKIASHNTWLVSQRLAVVDA